jgi:sulfur-oxidizing protein SoxX
MRARPYVLALTLAAGVALAVHVQAGREDSASKALYASFATAAPAWRARLRQDATQQACSQWRGPPPKAVADAIMGRERAAIVYPADGVLMGDWRKGEELAKSGYGGRFTDAPGGAENGGNCYACHRLDARELSYGTLGPSLTRYGSDRKFAAADIKAVYERIYNPQATVACTRMPRFGSNGFLTLTQIRDLVAYVMAPDSPVNR